MKSLSLIVMLSILSLNVSFAEDKCSEQVGQEEVTGQLEINTDVPAHLRGAVITITQADGKVSSVPAEKFKVVPRKQQFLTTKTERTRTLSCESIKRHRVSAVAGYGRQDGLNTSVNSNAAEVENKVGFVGGGQYQYRSDLKVFDLPVSFGVQYQNSKTTSGLVGVEW